MRDANNIQDDAPLLEEDKQFHPGRAGRVWMGVFLLLIGVLALLRSFGVPLPTWLFTWQMFLIGFGFFLGLKHGFRRGGWFIPLLIGAIFLANDYIFNGELRQHIWPVLLIIVGLLFITRKPKRFCPPDQWRAHKKKWAEHKMMHFDRTNYNADNYVDSTSIFGGSKKNILSKDFKGGDMVNIFGGTELNFSQADIQGKAELEITAVFGGATLVVPSNWIVQSDVVPIFGGIQDKRTIPPITEGADKILLLKGTIIFGGVDIKSF